MMAKDAWSDHEGISPEYVSPPQDQVDRQMIRHLLARYSKEELGRLLQEEGQSSLYNDKSLALSTSSRNSQDEPNMFESSVNGTTFSDTSSTCDSVASNVSPKASTFRGRKRAASISQQKSNSSQAHALTDESSWEAEDVTPTATAPKQKGSFTCGFCLEEGIQKTCTRKNDLKRHMEDFHHTNAQWFCRHRGCQMVFDWQTAYKAHLKSSHGGSRMNLDDAKVALCPQTVFACGFENCLQVFEASSDAEAGPAFKEYVSHVVKHFDEGASSGQWSYSARIRNLLRQSGVISTWSHSIWPESDRNSLRWHTQSSSILRKRLETRHLGDVQYIVQYAIALGSNLTSNFPYRADFVTPIRSECRVVMHGHKGGVTSHSPEPDHMQYSMASNGPNPALVAYYTSQRHAFLPQQPTQQSLPSAYTFHNGPPSPGYEAHQQALQQQYSMMGQSKAEQPAYMGISDSPMVGSDYVPHSLPSIPGPYSSGGMSSPAPTDVCGTASPGSGIDHQPNYSSYNSSSYTAY